MKSRLNLAKESFDNYIKKLDDFYKQATNAYSSLFGEESSDMFCRAISYVLRTFLESEDDGNSLFIQIPIEEIGLNESEQNTNFLKMEESIGHILSMAVYPEDIEATDLSSCNVGDFYYTAANIPCRGGTNRPRIWEINEGERNGKYPIERFRDVDNRGVERRISDIPGRRNIFNENINVTYKLISLPENNNKPTQRKMLEMANLLNVYRNNKPTKRYKSATIVGYGKPTTISDYECISYPLKFVNSFEDIDRRELIDIIFFAGDRWYNGVESRLGNRVKNGLTKKIVFVGSNLPKNFDGKIFSFSHREMYHYFAKDKLPSLEIKRLKWEKLENAISVIIDILNNANLNIEPQLKKRILHYSIAPYIGYKVDNIAIKDILFNIAEKELEYDKKEILKLIADKSLQIKLEGSPKKKEYDIIKNSCGKNKKCILIESRISYINKLNEHLTEKNKESNICVVDTCTEKQAIEVTECLLRKLTLGQICLLSYNYLSLSKVEDLFFKDYTCYNKEYRINILNGIRYDVIEENQNNYGSLDSFDDSELDNIMRDYYDRPQYSQYYSLVSDTGEEYDVSGDIVRYGYQINVGDLFDNAEDWLPSEVSFYQKPKNFQYLRDILYDLPSDANIDTYVKLWKTRLSERCRDVYNGDSKTMWETDGFKKIIKETKFKDIVESKYISNFPQEFFGMRSKMKELELINDDEYKYLGYAHNANKSSEIGRYIKNGLYDFILTGKCNEEHVNSICKNSKKIGEPLTLESLQELCIKTINIKEIKISNKRNDD
jgi:hypothetical protein